jgi:uncharacterized paraquat-inducible protein A
MGESNVPERADTSQALEHSLQEMESTLASHYCNLGKQILEVAEKEDREISQLVDEIIETKKKLSVLNRTILCPNCNTQNSSESNYCHACGTKLPKGENS